MLAPIQYFATPVNNLINKNFSMKRISMPADTVSFGYSSPLKNIAKHCAYCGCEMLTEEEVEQTVCKLAGYDGIDLQNEIKEVLRLMPETTSTEPRREILEEMLERSCTKPNLEGRLIVKEMLYVRENAFEEEIEESKESKEKIFAELESMMRDLPPYAQTLVDDLIVLDPALEITILKGINLIKKKCLKEGVELPQFFIDYANEAFEKFQDLKKDKTIADARLYTPHDFINRLISPLKITMEHVHPHSKKGDDETSNYLPSCASCNVERSNIPFVEQLKRHPEIVKWIKKSLEEVKRVIANMSNPPSELKTYISDITETLRVESKGKIDIKI